MIVTDVLIKLHNTSRSETLQQNTNSRNIIVNRGVKDLLIEELYF